MQVRSRAIHCALIEAMNRLTMNLNFANPIPSHNPGQDMFARDLAAIQSRSVFHTNVHLNRSSPSVFERSYALLDCSVCSLELCNNVFHCESADH